MGLKTFLSRFLRENVFNERWTCSYCGKEIFDENYFCTDCLNELPFNDKCICNHCGRATSVPEKYCLTCKEKLLSTDIARSVFSYQGKIKTLIKKMKYSKYAYLCDVFSSYLSAIYFKNLFVADFALYVPMTAKRERKRGYNQSKRLAQAFAEKTGVEVKDVLIKVKETEKQAFLSAKERRKNLSASFKIVDKKVVEGKSFVLIDDVTTTGSTAEVISALLKKYGAKSVILLTVASVKSKTGL